MVSEGMSLAAERFSGHGRLGRSEEGAFGGIRNLENAPAMTANVDELCQSVRSILDEPGPMNPG